MQLPGMPFSDSSESHCVNPEGGPPSKISLKCLAQLKKLYYFSYPCSYPFFYFYFYYIYNI